MMLLTAFTGRKEDDESFDCFAVVAVDVEEEEEGVAGFRCMGARGCVSDSSEELLAVLESLLLSDSSMAT